jgi:hypothetical protein
MKPICRYYNGCQNQKLLQDLYLHIAMVVKKNQQLLRNLYVGIAYLKWPYGNYNRM